VGTSNSNRFYGTRYDGVAVPYAYGSVTIRIKASTDGATTLSPMNLSGYVGHVTMFSSRVRVRIMVNMRLCVWLVSCYAHVFVRVSIVIVTLPAP